MHTNLILFAAIVTIAHAYPAVVRTSYGVVADARDDTVQCSDELRVCIGNEFSCKNAANLRHENVRYIVSLIGVPEPFIRGMEYYVTDLADTYATNMMPTWEEVHKFINARLADDPEGRVLVHCAAGVSRSASTIIYHHMRKHHIGYDEALSDLRRVRHVVQPNGRFERDLRALEWWWSQHGYEHLPRPGELEKSIEHVITNALPMHADV